MQQHISFNDIHKPQMKNFFKKLVMITHGHSKKERYIAGIQPKQYKGAYTKAEKVLRAKIELLEDELSQTSVERDAALEENRRRIDDLNLALLSVKEGMEKLIKSKKQKERRIRQLEEKINKTVSSKVSRH